MHEGFGMRTTTRIFCTLLALAPACARTSADKSPKLGDDAQVSADNAEAWTAESTWANAQGMRSACEQSIVQARAVRDAIREYASGDTPAASLEILRRFDMLTAATDEIGGIAAAMELIHPDPELREAAAKCSQALSAFGSEVNLDPEVYASLMRINTQDLDASHHHYVQRLRRGFEQSGVDKDESTRAQLAELSAEMLKVSQAFDRNIRNDRRQIELSSAAQMEGLPQDYIDRHAPNADGKIAITTDGPDFVAFQLYAKDAELRKKLFFEYDNRGYPANEELLRRQLQLRSDYAQLLGYDDWPSYATQDMMVGSSQAVSKFIADLREVVKSPKDREVEQSLARKRKDQPSAKRLEMWDRSFYRAQIQKENYGLDTQELRSYFAYPKVRDGILSVYAKLFGVEFRKVQGAKVWHDSVDAYELWMDGHQQGRFYFDMHPREGKYKHAAMQSFRTGTNEGRLPTGVLMCNFPDPAQGPALMEHAQVQVFFHEFGHLIHHMLGTGSPWVGESGIRTEWDFVEAPSQLLEEWAWDSTILAQFAHHHKTGEVIPAELVAQMRKASEFGKGMDMARQIFFAAFAYEAHTADPDALDFEKLNRKIFSEHSPFAYPEGHHFYTAFGHIMGYSSNVYTYQWSLVIAKEMFTRFEKAGLDSAEVAKDYREKVLMPGGSKDADEMVKDFLGRDYSVKAYADWVNGR